jgi:hypothetical protein
MSNELRRMWKDAVMAYFRSYHSTLLKEEGKLRENSVITFRSISDLNAKYEPALLRPKLVPSRTSRSLGSLFQALFSILIILRISNLSRDLRLGTSDSAPPLSFETCNKLILILTFKYSSPDNGRAEAVFGWFQCSLSIPFPECCPVG